MTVPAVFLVTAVILFAIGAWSRWWATPQPYYPSLVCGGLFFYAFSQLWPMISK